MTKCFSNVDEKGVTKAMKSIPFLFSIFLLHFTRKMWDACVFLFCVHVCFCLFLFLFVLFFRLLQINKHYSTGSGQNLFLCQGKVQSTTIPTSCNKLGT